MFGSPGAIATAPMDALPWWSNTDSSVVPLLTVFQTPPVAVPM